MRTLLFLLALLTAVARADEPTKKDLDKFEAQLKAAHANIGQSLASVVVSRSDKYPKPEKAGESWELGRFDRAAFLKSNSKGKILADRLDLSDLESIPDHGFAGGVVIDSTGLVLTTYHAIEGATKIYVHLADGAGSYADIRAADSRCDLAVLRLLDPPAGLKPVRFGSAKPASVLADPKAAVAPGTVGLVMGFAHTAGAAFDRPRAGLAFSQIRRPEVKGDASALFSSIYNYAPMIEYESKFSTGASGSVLLNTDGELIGLTTTTAALPPSEGRGHALPLNSNLTRVIEVLRRGEEVEYGFLGVTRTVDRFGPQGRGIPVEANAGRSTPAAAADLQRGDLITRINDVPVSNFEDLLLHVGHGLAGKSITLTVQRGVQSREAVVTLAKFKNEVPYIASVRPEPVFGLRVEYTSVLLQMQFNPLFGGRAFNDVPAGVLAREPVADSPAAEKFKQLGDNARWVVTHVNGKAVLTPAAFYKECTGKKTVTLTVVDANDNYGRTREVTLP